MKNLTDLIEHLYMHYKNHIPEARSLEATLLARGDAWVDDHIAFRTFPGKHTGAQIIANIFQGLGYERRDAYDFTEKKLSAFWLEPPGARGNQHHQVPPKVFVSELQLDNCSARVRDIVHKYTSDVIESPLKAIEKLQTADKNSKEFLDALTFCSRYLTAGVPWRRPRLKDYEVLVEESEYAAWTLLFGSVPNHFTICAHLMKTFQHLSELNSFLEHHLKITMNTAGGNIIKGTKDLLLEQSSTMAFSVPVLFQETVREVPFAYIEFAYRWPLAGKTHDKIWDSYYQGFVTNNADKIFESTFVGKK